MQTAPRSARRLRQATSTLLLGVVLVVVGGCTFFRNYGTGTHLDAPPEKTPHHGTAKASTMQIEITTDAAGQVTMIHFVKSSGSDAVDNFVADSLRHTSGNPSARTLVEIRYAPGTGFSEPKLLSSTPVS